MTKKRTRDEREDKKDDAYRKAYERFSYTSVPSNACLGSPHRYFESSYIVRPTNDNLLQTFSSMRIHRHANNLCVVTVGNLISDKIIESVQLHHQEAPPSSAGNKRKQQSKLLRGKETSASGIVRPDDILCTIKISDQSIIEVPCAVWGTVVEVNSALVNDCARIKHDPLFSGYLAVILPTGPFPPPKRIVEESK
ncbi:hypothetical protein FisN_2Hu253 [Fistulifera solaris]|jgi:hypothetical protein|uniref:Protein Abitram n=1 Tax=Fistulifera solaris TaxID=1519565 RepID=A0A1Z5JEW5_FISSO|nr:hypothetical protein FisN_2Hu253 [Fistulifera solaris]|eukprot:GAX12422.1 hypothetical protein FisN_2Hu253 [Fistulifera solaris]